MTKVFARIRSCFNRRYRTQRNDRAACRPGNSASKDVIAGHIELVSVVGMLYVENGRSFRMEVIETIPPYATRHITFKNTVGVKLYQSGGEEFPLMVIDLTWRIILAEEIQTELMDHQFPFVDQSGRIFTSLAPRVAVHMEGAIVGDILAEEVIVSTP